MNILYFHGLDRFASKEERMVLSDFGNLLAPTFDYQVDKNFIGFLQEIYKNQNIKVIIGTSMGGLVAYALACAMDKPCLLFNPTLGYAKVMEYPIDELQSYQYVRLVIGGRDKVVDSAESLHILNQKTMRSFLDVALIADMPHNVGIGDFRNQTALFFSSLAKYKDLKC